MDHRDSTLGAPLHRTWRGHLSWAVPLLLAPVSYFVLLTAGVALSDVEPSVPLLGLVKPLSVLALVIGGFVVPVVLLIRSLVALYRIWRSWRRSQGHFTKKERQFNTQVAINERAFSDGLRVREQLLRGETLPSVPVTDVLPAQGERLLLRGIARYRRYYGQVVNYSTSGTFAMGRPTFVAAMLVTSAIANSSARSRAEAAARAQWREDQALEVIVSDRRIWCRTPHAGWLTFDYAGVTALYPDPEHQGLVLEFERGEPLFLAGPIIPMACMIVVHARLGAEGLRTHPALAALPALPRA
ncbi:hypothetical protein NLU66_07420 [Brachybacterium sp. NBEC-018]|uniref:hypothetical protein n=1 Tax=Brachybacterium sp. NBEC-018 TaxID=2996004 RepID=UPI002175437F|nr:hypothetical protein [Brachybacterium sp. NBEC-018]UVY85409.1 hypothetical protein NLU66_07420 [Brachybacterium sp. NBEC-018]